MRTNKILNSKCKICGKNFYSSAYFLDRGWGKYCSSECQYKGFRTGRFVNCAYCGKKCYKSPARLKRQSKTKLYFCNKSCHCAWKNKCRKRENIKQKRKNFWRSWCNSSIRTCGVLGAGAEPVDLPRKIKSFCKRPPKKILHDFYWRKNYSQMQIAELFGVTHTSVKRWLAHCKIVIKPRALSCGRHLNSIKNLELGKTIESEKKSAKSRTIYSKENVIEKINEFVKNENRIPTKNEFNKNPLYPNHATCRDLFGSWNNAIKFSGYKPNDKWFGKSLIAKDGHSCDSVSEVIIDDWLFKNNIFHKREQAYPEGRYTCDFFINGVFIEFFGLANAFSITPNYSKIIKKKRILCRKHSILLIELYEKDLRNLKQALGKKLEQMSARSALSKAVIKQFYKFRARIFGL